MTVDAASIQRHKDYDDLAGVMRQGLKLALGFSRGKNQARLLRR
jgi:hypothetical protein